MNGPAPTQPAAWAEALPLPALAVLALLAVAAWWAAFRVFTPGRGGTLRRAGMLAGRLLVGVGAMMALSAVAGRFVVFGTPVPLPFYWVAGAGLVEAVVALYRAERARIARRTGLVLAGLRLTLALLVLAMLAQPVFVRESERRQRRTLAVMVDHSLSMQVPDTGLTGADRVRLAEALGVEGVARPAALDRHARRLEEARSRLAVQAEWLAMVAGSEPSAQERHIRARRSELAEEFEAAQEAAAEVCDTLAALADEQPDEENPAERLRARLDADVVQPLVQARDALREDAHAVLDLLGRAEAALQEAVPPLRELGRRTDEEHYAALPEQDREAVDELAAETRLELTRMLLDGREGGRGSLLSEVRDGYDVKLYMFAADAVEVGAVGGQEGADAAAVGMDATDLAAALERAARDVGTERLAGVVMLTDGRHNTERPVAEPARGLGVAGVPVSTVLFGAAEPPRDAAVLSVDVPETVFLEDRMLVTAELKLDGMAGETARVMLRRAEDDGEPLDELTLQVPTSRFRPRIELSHTPTEPGLRAYTVEVESVPGEVLQDNNALPLHVSVTEERTKMLLLEGPPRWEFRYLKNLFAERDPSVALQFVVFDPARVMPDAEMPHIPASAGRPREEPQATALPEREEDWMDFDVILLGDLTPEALPLEAQETIRRFVVDRGGTLVVVAGQHGMPHAFRRTPLAELLPVEPAGWGAEMQPVLDGFRMALTPEGRRSTITRLHPDPETNEETWAGLPEIYWRMPVGRVRTGASVLAYAAPLEEDEEEHDEDFRRRNALVAHHRAGMGRVMMLTFDHTWRMRFRAGDTHHHRFWGQAMRWAAGYRFAAGTDLVRLGADRPRYGPDEPVLVRARLLRPDFSPLANADVAVSVLKDGERALRRTLRYVPESPGLYEAELGRLPPGSYELKLESPQVSQVLGAGELEAAVAEFAVAPGAGRELAELAPDPGPPGRVAETTGGLVVAPPEARRVLQTLRAPVAVERERYEYVLWNSWPFLSLIMGVAAVEWLVRKRKALP